MRLRDKGSLSIQGFAYSTDKTLTTAPNEDKIKQPRMAYNDLEDTKSTIIALLQAAFVVRNISNSTVNCLNIY